MSMTEGGKIEGLHDDVMAEATTFSLLDDIKADLWGPLVDTAETIVYCLHDCAIAGLRPEQQHHSRLGGLQYGDTAKTLNNIRRVTK